MTIAPRTIVALSSTSVVAPKTAPGTVTALAPRAPGGAVAASSTTATSEPAPSAVTRSPGTMLAGTGVGGSGLQAEAIEPSPVAQPASPVAPSLEDLTDAAMPAGALEPFVFVVWLPVRGATRVSSAPFAALVGGRHDRVRDQLEGGIVARWDDPLSQWFPVWWSLAKSELSTVPRLAYAAQQMGLPS